MVRITGAILLTLLTTAAYAEQAPTDNELRSAYCAGVLHREIPWVRDHAAHASSADLQKVSAKMRTQGHAQLARLQTAQNRIKAYLTPRLVADVDPAAILMAMDRGGTDWKEFLMQTKEGRIEEGLGARIKRCADPNWIPL